MRWHLARSVAGPMVVSMLRRTPSPSVAVVALPARFRAEGDGNGSRFSGGRVAAVASILFSVVHALASVVGGRRAPAPRVPMPFLCVAMAHAGCRTESGVRASVYLHSGLWFLVGIIMQGHHLRAK